MLTQPSSVRLSSEVEEVAVLTEVDGAKVPRAKLL